MSRKSALRLLLLAALLPLIYFAAAGSAYLYRARASSYAARATGLQPFADLTSASRVLVFAPHPDDESLGCAGIIRHARSLGAAVRVVIATNGDGFRVAAERQFRRLDLDNRDYAAFGRLRQSESRAAMRNLGVERDDVTFLGYPDGSLMRLWETAWSTGSATTSRFTNSSRVLGPVGYRVGAAYCGQNVLDDMTAILREFRPTHVLVTHPSDDHVDHTALSAFVTLAVRRTSEAILGPGGGPRLLYYVVHRGDWPAPRGLARSRDLPPPTGMAIADTRWYTLPLSPDDERAKLTSLLQYRSQIAMMRPFLLSFVRRNELFGEVAEHRVPYVDDHIGPRDPMPAARWSGVPEAFADPVNDSLLRDFQGGGDVESVYVLRDPSSMRIRVETYEPLTRGLEFRLRMRYFGDPGRDTAGGTLAFQIRPPGRALPSDACFTTSERAVEVAIPLSDIGYANSVALSVETRIAGIQIDSTGYRFLRL